MKKKIVLIFMVANLAIPMLPSVGMCWYSRGYYHDDALAWGLGGLMVGTVVTAAALQPRPVQQVVYTTPPPAVYTSRPTNLPPGMCSWERYVLDGYGRTVVNQYNQPVMEYTVGPCQYPHN